MSDIKPNPLIEIGKRLNTQDNRGTADPIFLVQGLRRVTPVYENYGDCSGIVYFDSEDQSCYWQDEPAHKEEYERFRELERNNQLPENVKRYGYADVWETIQPCFTEEGCNQHIALDGHNIRSKYRDVRVYVDHLHRNPEMADLRKALMGLGVYENKDILQFPVEEWDAKTMETLNLQLSMAIDPEKIPPGAEIVVSYHIPQAR